jgi:hypothetical protein
MVRGMESTRIALVVVCPNSGNPELSSKIEPTPAIAATEEPNKKIPLLGVTKNIPRFMTIIRIIYRKGLCRGLKSRLSLFCSKKPQG